MKIYTRTGDRGETGLFGGGRSPKSSLRVEAYGAVDELNAFLGLAVAVLDGKGPAERLRAIQHDLFAIGSRLSAPPEREGRRRPSLPDVPESRIGQMEEWMDGADADLEPLRAFVLPGGSRAAAHLHVCRTVCRRAERAVVRLAREEEVDDGILAYLNRLSDLLFVLARLENRRAGLPDVPWEGGR